MTGGRRFFDREAPFGYALVLPAVVHLSLFIAYPFIMSIYLSLTDAQAGDARWNFVGRDNYSKVDSYEIRADDFVLATLPTQAEAERLVAAKPDGKAVTAPAGLRFRGTIEVGGLSIPYLEGDSESDVGFVGDTLLGDFEWR